MKIKANIPIKEYPPKLRALAIKRSLEQHPDYSIKTIKNLCCEGAFIWEKTPEGDKFWRKVANGIDFKLEEIPEKWYIKVTTNNREELHKWRTSRPEISSVYIDFFDTHGYVTSIPRHDHTYLDYNNDAFNAKNEGCIEITTEQFREYVSKRGMGIYKQLKGASSYEKSSLEIIDIDRIIKSFVGKKSKIEKIPKALIIKKRKK